MKLLVGLLLTCALFLPNVSGQFIWCKNYRDPVCGSNDRDYKNICELRKDSLLKQSQGKNPIWLWYHGRCYCNCTNCSTVYSPVCGSDGITYWNYCWLKCFDNCNWKRKQPKINFSKLGYC